MWKKINNVFIAIGNILTITAMVLAAIAVFSFVRAKQTGTDPYILGYRPIYIMTGSMEPEIKTHSIVLVKQLKDNEEIKKDEIIVFEDKQTVLAEAEDKNEDANKTQIVVHRVKDVDKETGKITTKGDNNYKEDINDITRKNVKAKVVYIANWFTYLYYNWQTRFGRILIITVPLGLFIIFQLIAYFVEKAAKKRKETDPKEECQDDNKQDNNNQDNKPKDNNQNNKEVNQVKPENNGDVIKVKRNINNNRVITNSLYSLSPIPDDEDEDYEEDNYNNYDEDEEESYYDDNYTDDGEDEADLLETLAILEDEDELN